MGRAPKTNIKEPKWQTHVYLSEGDFKLVKQIADEESRSVTMQIQHFIRMGIRGHDRKVRAARAITGKD